MNNKRFFVTLLMLFLAGITSAQKSYNSLMYEGNKLFESKKYDAASVRFLEAQKQKQKDFAAHYNLGNALYKRGKYEEAKIQYEKAQQLAQTLSDKSAALHNLGNTYMEMQQPEKAAEFYKQSLKQKPYSEETRKNYEIAKLKQKEKEQKKDQGKNGGSGNQKDDRNKNGDKGNDQGKTPQQGGSGDENKGQGQKGDDPSKKNNSSMPKGMQDAILNRVSDKERETAKRVLNKNSYSMPESNEKDW